MSIIDSCRLFKDRKYLALFKLDVIYICLFSLHEEVHAKTDHLKLDRMLENPIWPTEERDWSASECGSSTSGKAISLEPEALTEVIGLMDG